MLIPLHKSALSQYAGARKAIAMLQQSISARSAQQSALLSLSGRLDLALAQLPSHSSAEDDAALRVNFGTLAASRPRPDLEGEEPAAIDAFADGVQGGESSGSESEMLSDEDGEDADSEYDDDVELDEN